MVQGVYIYATESAVYPMREESNEAPRAMNVYVSLSLVVIFPSRRVHISETFLGAHVLLL